MTLMREDKFSLDFIIYHFSFILGKDRKAVYSSRVKAVECRTACPCQIDRVKMLREIMETFYSVRSGIKKPFLVIHQHWLPSCFRLRSELAHDEEKVEQIWRSALENVVRWSLSFGAEKSLKYLTWQLTVVDNCSGDIQRNKLQAVALMESKTFSV